MPCPDDNELTEFVAGVLSDGSIASIEAHIDTCEACRETLAALARCTFPLDADPTDDLDAPEWMHDGLADGRCVPLHVVGAGGMSLVYEGFDTTLRRSVAIKVMLDAPAAAADRLAKEARALARLSHPNIVDVFDLELRAGHAFLITELVEGGSLRAWLAETHRTTADIVRVLVDTARGLAAAHERGVVHRDVTPNNILVGSDGRARVADFGLGGMRPDPMEESAELVENEEVGSRTAVGGTPGYIAPEVLDGKEIGPAADQYGLGVVGREVLPNAPAAVARVLARARAQDPEQRFGSMSELAFALERAGKPAVRKPWVAVGAAALALGTYAWWSESQTRTPCVDAPAPSVKTDSQVFDGLAQSRVEAWVGVQTRLCADELEADVFDRRWECLRRYREALETQALHVGSSDLASHVETLERLGDPIRCEDDEWLARSVVLPPEELREDAERLRTVLTKAEAEYRVDHSQAARETLDVLQVDAEALGYEPFIAEVMLMVGHSQRQAGEVDAARKTMVEAAHRAAAAGVDDLAARAWLSVVYVIGFDAMELEPALEALRFADSFLARVDEPASLMGYRAQTLGLTYSRRGEHERAHAYLEEAAARLREAHGDEALLVAEATTSLGINHAIMGDIDAARVAFEEARRIVTVRLGEQTPKLGEMLGNAAALEFAAGNVSEATALARRALDRLEPTVDPTDARLVTLRGLLGQTLYFDGNTAEALPHLRAAYEGRAAQHSLDHPAVLESRYQLAMAYRDANRWSDAEAILADAEAQSENPAVPPHLHGLLLYELGLHAIERRQPSEALRLCTRARGLLEHAKATQAAANAQVCIDAAT